MMRVLLFDIHSRGHHLENGSKFQRALNRREGVNADFLVPWKSDVHDEYFTDIPLFSLYNEPPDWSESTDLDTGWAKDRLLRATRDFLESNPEYDLVHFFHTDYCTRWIHKHFYGIKEPPLVGTLNGAYYFDRTAVNRIIYRLLKTPVSPYIFPLVPDNPSRHVNLYRCLKNDVLNHLFVHSEASREHVRAFGGINLDDRLTVVPDPADRWYEDAPSDSDARAGLNLSQDHPILLFFGEIRRGKGIDVLLEAVERFNGPSVTVAIAGPPTSGFEERIEQTTPSASVTLKLDLRFIPNEDIEQYYAAADAVILPYRRFFGTERTSNVFQNTLGSLTPVITPDFGTLGKRTREYDLGITFTPESASSLTTAMEQFVTDPEECYDKEQLQAYAESQTYDTLAERSIEVYRSLADDSEGD